MLKRLHQYIRSFFNFSHAEASGFLVMVLLLLAASIGWLVYRNMPGSGYTAYAKDKALLDSLMLEMEALNQPAGNFPEPSSAPAEAVVYFTFNPNQLPADSLELLGVPRWLAQRIDNYRQKGGQFRQKEDLMKIYDFPDSLYQALAPYIQIAPASSLSNAPKNRREEPKEYKGREKRYPDSPGRAEKVITAFDINKADSLELQQISGIGPVLSGRIVKFRDKLGGFSSLRQLYEVWGLDSAVVSRVMESAFIEENFTPDTLRINTASQEELAAHPYIDARQARLIYNYRMQHGPFRSVEDLRKMHILDAGFVQKIAPYILLE